MTNETLFTCKHIIESERVRVFKQTGGRLPSLERALKEINEAICSTCHGTKEIPADETGQDMNPCPDCKKEPFKE